MDGAAGPVHTEPLQLGFRRHLSELINLATPMILARSGIILMMTIDLIMVGHYSTDEVAFLALGTSVVMPMLVVGLGLLMGTLVVVSNSFGAGKFDACGAAWRNALPYAVVLGGAAIIITYFGEPILLLFGQSGELAERSGEVLRIAGLSLPVFFLYIATAFFLEGIGRPVPAMIAMLVANIVNILCNWILIFGNLGFPELGAVGAVWATVAARGVAAAIVIAYVWAMVGHELFAVRKKPLGGWRSWRAQRRIGYATSISIGGESCAFAALHIFAGWIGPLALAAFSVTFNMINVIFMLALGLGAATSVRVGIAYGRNDTGNLRRSGWVGLGANTAAMACVGIVLLAAPHGITTLFTNDTLLIGAAAPLIAFTAYLLIVDGGQAVMANALRGRRDVWLPCSVQLISYLGLMIPCAYYFAFMAGHGVIGLLYGILVASGISIMFLGWRFWLLAQKDNFPGTAMVRPT